MTQRILQNTNDDLDLSGGSLRAYSAFGGDRLRSVGALTQMTQEDRSCQYCPQFSMPHRVRKREVGDLELEVLIPRATLLLVARKIMAYETRCFKVRLRPQSLDRVKEWSQTIQLRRDEALATLRDENVVVEAVFLERTTDGDFLIYCMTAESFEKSGEVARASLHAIDEYHRRFKLETFDQGVELERLIDLNLLPMS